MKILTLVYKIISNFFRSKKLISCVFVCAAVLFGVSFLTVLGAFTPFFADVNSEEDKYCLHTICFEEVQSVSDVEAFTSNKFYRSKRYTELNSSTAAADGTRFHITTFYGHPDELLRHVCRDGRLTFTTDEASGAVPAVFVSSDLCKTAGETITLPFWDVEFFVAGVIDNPFDKLIVVPRVWFEKADLKVWRMLFYTSRKLSVIEEKKLQYDLCGDGKARVVGGITYEQAVENNTVDLFGSSILAVLVLVLGFYLMNYASQKNNRTYSLLGILGSSKTNTLFLLMLERIVSTFVIMVISALIHFCIRDMLHAFLLIPKCRMGFTEYAVALGIAVLASVFSSIPFAVYYVRNSYTTVVKHYE